MKYYNSIANCPLSVFIQVSITGDVRNLVINGIVSDEKLNDAWDNIFYDYLKRTDITRYNILLRKLKDIEILSNKYRLIWAIIEMLSLGYNLDLVSGLKSLGYRYRFERFSDPKSYVLDVERVQKDAESIMKTINEMKAGLIGSPGEEVKEEDFDGILVDLSRFQGYKVKKEETTVSEFVNIFEKYKKHGK